MALNGVLLLYMPSRSTLGKRQKLQQWDGLQQQLAQRSQRVLVVGAGMIGCEMAEDLARAGHQVTLLDRQAWPLAALLPQQAGERLLQGLQDMGVQYHGQVEVAGVQASADGARQLTLSDGRVFEADVVLAATGLMVESRVLQSAGLVLDKGIVVDPATLQTSAADVYALGDCISLDGQPCRFIEPIAGQAVSSPLKITGSAMVFEATVSYRLKDDQGKFLASGFTTASMGAPERGDYNAEVTFTSPGAGKKGQLEVYEVSMKDDSDRNKVIIPLVFK